VQTRGRTASLIGQQKPYLASWGRQSQDRTNSLGILANLAWLL